MSWVCWYVLWWIIAGQTLSQVPSLGVCCWASQVSFCVFWLETWQGFKILEVQDTKKEVKCVLLHSGMKRCEEATFIRKTDNLGAFRLAECNSLVFLFLSL